MKPTWLNLRFLIRMLEFSLKNATHELLAMNAETNVRNMATGLQDTALLD